MPAVLNVAIAVTAATATAFTDAPPAGFYESFKLEPAATAPARSSSSLWRMGPPGTGISTTQESGKDVAIIVYMTENCGVRVRA
jgi:hypothetical protein